MSQLIFNKESFFFVIFFFLLLRPILSISCCRFNVRYWNCPLIKHARKIQIHNEKKKKKQRKKNVNVDQVRIKSEPILLGYLFRTSAGITILWNWYLFIMPVFISWTKKEERKKGTKRTKKEQNWKGKQVLHLCTWEPHSFFVHYFLICVSICL